MPSRDGSMTKTSVKPTYGETEEDYDDTIICAAEDELVELDKREEQMKDSDIKWMVELIKKHGDKVPNVNCETVSLSV